MHVLFPFVTKDDYDGYDRDEFLMNTEYVSFASSANARKAAPYNIALLFVWTGTKKMSSKVSKTIKDCETYLNATPPASRTSRDPLLSAGAAAGHQFFGSKAPCLYVRVECRFVQEPMAVMRVQCVCTTVCGSNNSSRELTLESSARA